MAAGNASAFERILVPLDGSELSVRIVTHVRRLLLRRDAEVLLVRVLASPDESADAARVSLDEVARALRAEGATVRAEVVRGDPADRIIELARGAKPTLIAMATHGRTGIARWIRGSTAERVLRSSECPLLLANPFALEPPAELRFRKILVPLDGSPVALEILPLVREVASLYGSEVVLHMTVEVPALDVPVALPAIGTEDAVRLLETYRDRLPGIPVRTRADYGRAAPSILDAADHEKADLIALSTHGLSGTRRWLLGSVAENVLRHASCPLLVRRAAPAPASPPRA